MLRLVVANGEWELAGVWAGYARCFESEHCSALVDGAANCATAANINVCTAMWYAHAEGLRFEFAEIQSHSCRTFLEAFWTCAFTYIVCWYKALCIMHAVPCQGGVAHSEMYFAPAF
jgi:hypothetical protein